VRGEQEIIVRYAPDEALAALPQLLRNEADRTRLVTLVQRLLADERVQRAKPSNEQLAMIEHIGSALSATAPARPRTTRKRTSRRKQAARK
jgi:nitrogen-specific signal transduction histidine kinase